jgi:osmotically-inducible protein OsmY
MQTHHGTPPAPTDAQIRSTLLATLARQPWWQAAVSNVFVADGVVIYQGLFSRAHERRAARAIAAAIAGVRAIRDDRIRAREWQAMA